MGAGASAAASFPSDLVGGELDITIVEGKDLVAKDGGLFTKASSDPFVMTVSGHVVYVALPRSPDRAFLVVLMPPVGMRRCGPRSQT